jgi:predicted DNA-binding protein with PD1-like motif
MQWKLINKEPKTYAVILTEGEEVMESLTDFVQAKQLAGSQLSAIGAFSEVVLGHFNLEKRGYKRIPIPQQVEVLSLTGQVTMDGDQPHLHAQVVVGRSDASGRPFDCRPGPPDPGGGLCGIRLLPAARPR